MNRLLAALASAVLVSLAACHSHHIDITIENRTGGAIELLEIDYPSASFGANNLAAGAEMHYRIQVRGSGALKMQFTGPAGNQVAIDGPDLAEDQEGRLEIDLLPAGKAEFHPELTPGK